MVRSLLGAFAASSYPCGLVSLFSVFLMIIKVSFTALDNYLYSKNYSNYQFRFSMACSTVDPLRSEEKVAPSKLVTEIRSRHWVSIVCLAYVL